MDKYNRYTPRISDDYFNPERSLSTDAVRPQTSESVQSTLGEKLTKLHQAVKAQQSNTQNQVKKLFSTEIEHQEITSKIEGLQDKIVELIKHLEDCTSEANVTSDLGVAQLIREVTFELTVAQEEFTQLQQLLATPETGEFRKVKRTTNSASNGKVKGFPEVRDLAKQYHRNFDECLQTIERHSRTLRRHINSITAPSQALEKNVKDIEGQLKALAEKVRVAEETTSKVCDKMSQEELDAYHLQADRVKEKIQELHAQHAAFQIVFSLSTQTAFHAVDTAHTILKGVTSENAPYQFAKAVEPLYHAQRAIKQNGPFLGKSLAQQEFDAAKREFNNVYTRFIAPLSASDLRKLLATIHYKNVNESQEEVVQAIEEFETLWNNLTPAEREQAFIHDNQFKEMFHAYSRRYGSICMPVRKKLVKESKFQTEFFDAISRVHVLIASVRDQFSLGIGKAYQALLQARKLLPSSNNHAPDALRQRMLSLYVKAHEAVKERYPISNLDMSREERDRLQLFPLTSHRFDRALIKKLVSQEILTVLWSVIQFEGDIVKGRIVTFETEWASLRPEQQSQLKKDPDFVALWNMYEDATASHNVVKTDMRTLLEPLVALRNALENANNTTDDSEVLIAWTATNRALEFADEFSWSSLQPMIQKARALLNRLESQVDQAQQTSPDSVEIANWKAHFSRSEAVQARVITDKEHPIIRKMIIDAIRELRYKYPNPADAKDLIATIERGLSVLTTSALKDEPQFARVIAAFKKDYDGWIHNTPTRLDPEFTSHLTENVVFQDDYDPSSSIEPSKPPIPPASPPAVAAPSKAEEEAVVNEVKRYLMDINPDNAGVQLNLALQAYAKFPAGQPEAGLALAYAFYNGQYQTPDSTEARILRELQGMNVNYHAAVKPVEINSSVVSNLLLKKIALINWTAAQGLEIQDDQIKQFEEIYSLVKSKEDINSALQKDHDFTDIIANYHRKYADEIERARARL